MNWRNNRLIKVSGGILVAIVLLALIGPFISPHEYQQTNFDKIFQAPGLSDFHLFGTDDLGRDLFVRTLLGVQITILVALVASIVSLVIGVLYGAIAGLAGGRVDAVMMRFVDTLYALPFIFFVILLILVRTDHRPNKRQQHDTNQHAAADLDQPVAAPAHRRLTLGSMTPYNRSTIRLNSTTNDA